MLKNTLENYLGQKISFEMNFSSNVVEGVLKELDSNIMTVITHSGIRYVCVAGVKRLLLEGEVKKI